MEKNTAYKYYKFVHLDTVLPVYACDGSDEEQAAFRKDTDALGMKTRIINVNGNDISFAADILDNGDHVETLERAANWFRQRGRVPLDTKRALINGPIPQDREFSVCTVWQVWGKDTITLQPGQTLQAALTDYLENAPLPDEEDYVSGSQEIDYETGFNC